MPHVGFELPGVSSSHLHAFTYCDRATLSTASMSQPLANHAASASCVTKRSTLMTWLMTPPVQPCDSTNTTQDGPSPSPHPTREAEAGRPIRLPSRIGRRDLNGPAGAMKSCMSPRQHLHVPFHINILKPPDLRQDSTWSTSLVAFHGWRHCRPCAPPLEPGVSRATGGEDTAAMRCPGDGRPGGAARSGVCF